MHWSVTIKMYWKIHEAKYVQHFRSLTTSMFCIAYLPQGCREPRIYFRELGAQNMGQSGWGGNLLHGTITHTYTGGNLGMSIILQCMSLDWSSA